MQPLRVALLTNLTSGLALPVLDQLARSDALQLCHVFFYDTIAHGRKSFRQVLREHGVACTLSKIGGNVRQRIRLMMRKTFAGRGGHFEFCHEYAVAHGIPFTISSDMNKTVVAEELKKLEIDILLCCSCRQILGRALLAVPQTAAINIHPSLLPKYRGPMPVFWTIFHREREAGVTFHLMSLRPDEGDIIAQFRLPIEKGCTAKALEKRLFHEAGVQLDRVLTDFAGGRIEPTAQNNAMASYQGYPTLRQRGLVASGRLA